jgi:hypothetical protein
MRRRVKEIIPLEPRPECSPVKVIYDNGEEEVIADDNAVRELYEFIGDPHAS